MSSVPPGLMMLRLASGAGLARALGARPGLRCRLVNLTSDGGQTMPTVREPFLEPVAIASLRPTQLTVGMREVKAKRNRWREIGAKKKRGGEFLGKHMIPVSTIRSVRLPASYAGQAGSPRTRRQRIPLGGLLPAPGQAQGRRERLRARARDRVAARQE